MTWDHPRIRGEHLNLPTAGDDKAADHPRIRGEHRRFSSPSAAITGSSPHTRGAPEQPSTKSPWSRIIPAYAGSTPPQPRWAWERVDHPRIRGEHVLWRDSTLAQNRIIPAYAGSTRSA